MPWRLVVDDVKSQLPFFSLSIACLGQAISADYHDFDRRSRF